MSRSQRTMDPYDLSPRRVEIDPSIKVPLALARIGCDLRIQFEKDTFHPYPGRFMVTASVRRMGDDKVHHLRFTIYDDAPLTVEHVVSRMLREFAANNIDVP